MAPCKFFALGRCTFGAKCKNSHEATGPRWATIDKSALLADDSANSQEPLAARKSATVCHFYLKGTCHNGDGCRYLHSGKVETVESFNYGQSLELPIHQKERAVPDEITSSILRPEVADFKPSGIAVSSVHTDRSNYLPLQISSLEVKPKTTIPDKTQREINGAFVDFQAGAEVTKVKLPSDFSTILIEGLGVDAKTATVSNLLSLLGATNTDTNITLRKLGENSSVAEVRVEDPSFAKRVTESLESQKSDPTLSKVTIKPVVRGTAGTASGNRLQISTITCTWYQASRAAWLQYRTLKKAEKVDRLLRERKIHQRTLECSIQNNRNCYTVEVSNLHGRTTKEDIKRTLPDYLLPVEITMGDPTYRSSDDESATVVKCLLQALDGLESFQASAMKGTSKMKAFASFSGREHAAEAVHKLNSTKISRLGDTKLFVTHVITVKYNVLNPIMEILQPELNRLQSGPWAEMHIRLKLYQQDFSKPFTTLRISGADFKHVAKAKSTVEAMLAGSIVLNGDRAMWDPLLLTADSLNKLNVLSTQLGVYIQRDTKKSRLLIYSSSATATIAATKALDDLISRSRGTDQLIVLSSELLKNAMHGGMQRLKDRFGAQIVLNLTSTLKTISVLGSQADLDEACAILATEATTKGPTHDDNDCIICWCPASNPLTTICGHTYCMECLVNQTSSSNAAPVQCLGDDSKCKHIFTMEELMSMLPAKNLEDLLHSSFDTYIRQHPEKFHYCPSPDCPQIYRKTTSGDTVLCSICLSSTCTSCNVVSHDGMSCADYQDLSSEGTAAFAKYKKDNDVRDCPKCKVGIQKSYGCNHMTCVRCQSHICWFCMEVFETDRGCYAHMSTKHGGPY